MLVLPDDLTHLQANACLPMLVQAIPSQTGPAAQVDASALERFDSSTLAVLLEFRRACLAQGKGLELLHLNPRLIELARLYGVDGLLAIH
ncbi:anti-sigma-factor antagonist [Hylemonella gracilis str. Niagara R]|uniref:Anti-sigma-factor antagonist n=1 Tax=Hylemonella gracilis str. Niagara R TaxID=1458275 RepID=A0A016XK29_9BURK|nr:STAS domain-containing protein [Hylemonella gracilis]EYC52265.1 anti-sigma-factor antagonist [Hylemonella gracilis str. Niagara R]